MKQNNSALPKRAGEDSYALNLMIRVVVRIMEGKLKKLEKG